MILPAQTVLRCASSAEGQHYSSKPVDKSWYMAFSMTPEDRRFTRIKTASDSERILLSDRKRWLDHLSAGALAKSTMRVVAIQSSNMIAYYFQDQLSADMEREEQVKEGKLSAEEADKLQEEWEEREWNIRIKALPKKIVNGIFKFHAITMVMRFLEFVAEKFVDEFTLDRLTIDSFSQAQRLSKRSHDNSHLRKEMYDVCLWSSAIAFCADYSVHQVILSYTYYRYYTNKRGRRKREDADETTEKDLAPLMFSFFTKSTSLFLSRSIGLIASAFGGAYGSAFYPGWGTLFGSQFGDGVVATLFDELQPQVMNVENL
mmetsp:Transcript_3368/g.5021  ORF Transcript_3368/g.5021 Transcript_3368/m.5021 type:complete len:317 (-) Transcript_3368:60-1010(-)|eukprot:CAMPEP_0194216012 /NCGR_PEP_ID=MMETSP0156-20130528/18212_1 /TAXON_ID=33649 /ORGANISM="Thalassionema nitzschioides, Strain L26-B" /LENGTH=316 /DNA_ID=CAMNT_0038944677 /DNA_START=68 /DNA_END=1018 /DNA_ORIENTATION=+